MQGNPVNYVDPSGYCGVDSNGTIDGFCYWAVDYLEQRYGVIIYWPDRTSGLPFNIEPYVREMCIDDYLGYSDYGIDLYENLTLRKWSGWEMLGLLNAIWMYTDELGLNATRMMLTNLVFAKANNRNDTWLGEYYQFPVNEFGDRNVLFLYDEGYDYDTFDNNSLKFLTKTFVHESLIG